MKQSYRTEFTISTNTTSPQTAPKHDDNKGTEDNSSNKESTSSHSSNWSTNSGEDEEDQESIAIIEHTVIRNGCVFGMETKGDWQYCNVTRDREGKWIVCRATVVFTNAELCMLI